jgi:hypothetical protein
MEELKTLSQNGFQEFLQHTVACRNVNFHEGAIMKEV